MTDDRHRIRINIAWQEPAMIQIGKGGVSDNLVKETVRFKIENKGRNSEDIKISKL